MTRTVATIRSLGPADPSILAGVLARAYETTYDFEPTLVSYLTASTVATFVAEWAGEPVGMVVGSSYGCTAYVAQMGIDPRLQRRGIATALMESLMAWAADRRFSALELDATDAGAPLYARFGFVAAGRTLVFDAAATAPWAATARPYSEADRDALFAADARAFGADRSAVLSRLIESAPNAVFVTGAPGAVDGYAVAQPRPRILGPVIAPSAAAAARLIDTARSYLPAAHRVNFPSENEVARALLVARGYRPARSLTHMVRGTRPAAAARTLFARISLGQG